MKASRLVPQLQLPAAPNVAKYLAVSEREREREMLNEKPERWSVPWFAVNSHGEHQFRESK